MLNLRALLADNLEGEGNVVEDSLLRQQAEVLEDIADALAQLRHIPPLDLVHVVAGDVQISGIQLFLAQDELQKRGLTGAGGADKEDELALFDVQGDVVQGRPPGRQIALGYVFEGDHEHTV